MARDRGHVERPYRKSEYRIRFATREAEKGWQDLVATARNAAADTWDFLTKNPAEPSEICYPLRDSLGVVRLDGVDHTRWQYKPTAGARIWYAVVSPPRGGEPWGLVLLERVTTSHPNETIKNFR